MKAKSLFMFSLMQMALTLCAPHARAGQPPTRAQFVAALAKVEEGMGADEVTGLLGKPDDLITQADPTGDDDDPTAEVWCYGTDGHLTLPTLGKVWMSHGKVQRVLGTNGTPPDALMFAEPELRKLLLAIDACRGSNPQCLIRAVNMLQPLGKEKALAALREYERVGGGRLSMINPVCLIGRLLFETQEPLPVPGFFSAWPVPMPPKDLTPVPLYPLVVTSDIPIHLAYEYYPGASGGWLAPPDAVEYFRKNGTLRQHPLAPGNDPLSLFPALVKSPQWIFPTGKGKDGYDRDSSIKDFVADQFLRLVDTVYRVERDHYGYRIMGKRTLDQYWADVTREVAALNIHWDAEKNEYVFPDGHTLPDDSPPIYKRQIWELPFAKVPARLIFARRAKDYITITFAFPREVYNPVPDSLITVSTTGKNARQLLQFKIGYSAKRGEIVTHFWNREFELAEGTSVQAEVSAGDKATMSPVYTP